MTLAPEFSEPSRPRRKPVRRNPHQTVVRWNSDDYTKLLANAEKAGLSVSSYIRFCALEKPVTPSRRRASVDLTALAKALALVNRMGGNLHQLVKHLNFGGIPYPDEVRAALRGFDEMVFALMDAMGRQR